MWQLKVPALIIALRSAAIYAGLLLGLRIAGKREVGQFTLFDLVLVLLVANAVQPAMTGPDTSLIGGFIIMVTLFALNWGVATLTLKAPAVRKITEGKPSVIARDGHWLHDALRDEQLTPRECEPALREHGLDNVRDVALAVLEVDGTVSVVPRDSDVRTGGRDVRASQA